MFEASDDPAARRAGELCALAAHLQTQVPEAAAVDLVPAADTPSGRPTVEITVTPEYVDDAGRVPAGIARAVYDPDAPWHAGIVRASRRAVDLLTILVR